MLERDNQLVWQLYESATNRERAGDFSGALSLISEFLRVSPGHQDGWMLLVRVLLKVNPELAVVNAQQLAQLSPKNIEALNLLGQAYSAVGRTIDAAQAFYAASNLSPANGAVLNNLSVARLRAGDLEGALYAAQQAVAFSPTLPDAYASLGNALSFLNQDVQAIEAYKQAISLAPSCVDAYVGIARAYRAMGRPSTAILALLRAIDQSPNWIPAHVDLASLFREVGEFRSAYEMNQRIRKLSPQDLQYESNVLLDLQYRPDVDESEAMQEALAWGLRIMEQVPPVQIARLMDTSSDRPLRIGYVTSDLCRHPVGYFCAAAIASQNPSSCQVVIYANQSAHDEITELVKRSASAWVPIFGLSDASVADRIVADQFDILVDLSGHTAGNRLGVFARRPAPIQISWLGYCATTGLPTIDYFMSDELHAQSHIDTTFSEQIYRLPRIGFAYTPPTFAPDIVDPPSLQNGFVRFGCFNNISKINDGVIELWSRVLRETFNSELLLKWRHLADPFVQESLRSKFAKHGIEEERVLFDGASEHVDMLGQYGEIDIALDPFPFCGGLTTCEALWMGVPVVTLPKQRLASRQSTAILQTIGFSEWSAKSADEYVAIATRIASDGESLQSIRHSLRSRMQQSKLLNPQDLGQCLDRAFRELFFSFHASP